MPNPSRYGGTLEAAIRAHFGLTHIELARYLGVSERQIGNIESGRRLPSPTLNKRLHWLADLLPPPESHGPAAPDFRVAPPPPTPPGLLGPLPEFGELEAKPLRKRWRQAGAQAAALRWELHKAGKRAARQARRQWTLAVLEATAPPAHPTAADAERFGRWLAALGADVRAGAPTPATATAQVLAVLRLRALEAEAAALELLLGAQ